MTLSRGFKEAYPVYGEWLDAFEQSAEWTTLTHEKRTYLLHTAAEFSGEFAVNLAFPDSFREVA